MCEVYSVMLTCPRTILLVSPQYASKWWCRHAIVLASACCHGCMRKYAFAYAQTTISNMNISCLEFSCSLCTFFLNMFEVYSVTMTYSLTILLALRRYAGTCIRMLSWWHAHMRINICAYSISLDAQSSSLFLFNFCARADSVGSANADTKASSWAVANWSTAALLLKPAWASFASNSSSQWFWHRGQHFCFVSYREPTIQVARKKACSLYAPLWLTTF